MQPSTLLNISLLRNAWEWHKRVSTLSAISFTFSFGNWLDSLAGTSRLTLQGSFYSRASDDERETTKTTNERNDRRPSHFSRSIWGTRKSSPRRCALPYDIWWRPFLLSLYRAATCVCASYYVMEQRMRRGEATHSLNERNLFFFPFPYLFIYFPSHSKVSHRKKKKKRKIFWLQISNKRQTRLPDASPSFWTVRCCRRLFDRSWRPNETDEWQITTSRKTSHHPLLFFPEIDLEP